MIRYKLIDNLLNIHIVFIKYKKKIGTSLYCNHLRKKVLFEQYGFIITCSLWGKSDS